MPMNVMRTLRGKSAESLVSNLVELEHFYFGWTTRVNVLFKDLRLPQQSLLGYDRNVTSVGVVVSW